MKITLHTPQKDSILAAIDEAADALRQRVVVDPVRVAEYDLARTEAQAFKDAGYTGDVPATVASWAKAKQWQPQQAADDILATAAAWYGALYRIRDLRLQAKEDVRNATRWEDVIAIRDGYLAQLGVLASGLAQ